LPAADSCENADSRGTQARQWPQDDASYTPIFLGEETFSQESLLVRPAVPVRPVFCSTATQPPITTGWLATTVS